MIKYKHKKEEYKIKEKELNLRNKITLITFVCSLLVIYRHAYNLGVYGIEKSSIGFAKIIYYIEEFVNNGTVMLVPMFFFISGILFFRTFEMKKILSKYKSRIKSVLIPYIIWCTIYYVLMLILTHISSISASMSNGNAVNLSIKELLLWMGPKKYYHLWYLQNLIIFIGITPIIYFITSNHNKKIPIGLINTCMIIIMLQLIKHPELIRGIEFYIVGSYIGINHKELLLKECDKKYNKYIYIYNFNNNNTI